jgi:hypothetical protein
VSHTSFADQYHQALVAGTEKAYMRAFCSDLAFGVLSTMTTSFHRSGSRGEPPTLMDYIEHEHWIWRDTWPEYLRTYPSDPFKATQLLKDRLEMFLNSAATDNYLTVRVEHEENPVRAHVVDVALNTALAMGNDPIKLMARLTGQAEDHCWVDGPNRAWLADVIEDGLERRIFRQPFPNDSRTWQSVVALLRERDDCPVVCSYSVSTTFPESHLADTYLGMTFHNDGRDGDTWYDLAAADQWRIGIKALRARDQSWAENYPYFRFELAPGEIWEKLRFEWGVSAFDVQALAWKQWVEVDRSALR